MIRIEAKNLHEAYSKAASELQCSVTEITMEIIQKPSSGFLGMFQKNAIVEARKISDTKNETKVEKKSTFEEKKSDLTRDVVKDEKRKSRNRRSKNRKKESSSEKPLIQNEVKQPSSTKVEKKVEKKEQKPKAEATQKVDTKTIFDEDFHKPKVDVNVAVVEIKENINKLFKHSCFTLDAIKVEVFNENTVLIEFSGEDSALLIGKEGYRYKSLSYLLYNWINIKYNLNIRLEIAEFLKNQEEMIDKYLVSVIERVNNNGRAQTKILDGVLVKIALEALRKEFPNKYVGIKSGREGGKFIVINDFNRKNQ
jgi:spoIIIJ-associated protein